MKRETIIFTVCGFLLGLTLGSFVIGPKIAQSKLAGAPVVAESAPETPPATASGSPMGAVMQQLATLKAAVAKNPNDAEALAQLGDMYMQAAKFPQAAEYLQRALAVRDDAAVRRRRWRSSSAPRRWRPINGSRSSTRRSSSST